MVRELAQQSANWKFYDKKFRLLRQKSPSPWDQILSELYLRAHLTKVKNIKYRRHTDPNDRNDQSEMKR